MTDPRIERIARHVRTYPDFPKPGIQFKDLMPVLAEPDAYDAVLSMFADRFAGARVDRIVGIESRGFIFGAGLAVKMGVGLVPVRKPGKLPGTVDRITYALEYGSDTLEMQHDGLREGARVLVIDDLLATGGTAAATIELVKRRGAQVIGAAFVIELGFLEGSKKLAPTETFSILKF